MPDTCEVRTTTYTQDRMGKRVRSGTTTADTVSCRRKDLTGRELEIAQGLAAGVTTKIALPYDTTVTTEQELYHQETGDTLNVLYIAQGTLAIEKVVLCSKVTQ